MKRVNNILIGLISILAIIKFFMDLGEATIDRLLPSLTIVIILFVPKLLRKLYKLKINNAIELTYIVFIILSLYFGGVLNLYNKVWWYDMFAHFISGILTTVLAVIIMCYLKVYNKKNIAFNILYMISFTLMVACVWEFLEYGIDNVMGLNTQHYLDTGVGDTMQDMLIALAGAVIAAVMYFYEEEFKKKGLIKRLIEDID